MTRKYQNHTSQTNSRHREEEKKNSNITSKKTIKVRQPALSAPVLHNNTSTKQKLRQTNEATIKMN